MEKESEMPLHLLLLHLFSLHFRRRTADGAYQHSRGLKALQIILLSAESPRSSFHSQRLTEIEEEDEAWLLRNEIFNTTR